MIVFLSCVVVVGGGSSNETVNHDAAVLGRERERERVPLKSSRVAVGEPTTKRDPLVGVHL